MRASRSGTESVVPYTWPVLVLPFKVVSKRTPSASAPAPLLTKPTSAPVVHVVCAVERDRALVREEQRSQVGNRSVVQVRRAQPQAVERHVGVAVRLPEMAEAPGLPLADRVHAHRQFGGERLEALRVGLDVGDVGHRARSRAVGRMAARARLLVDAAHRSRRVRVSIRAAG